jgi:hypothetical protein
MVRNVSGGRQAGLSRDVLEVIVGGAEIAAVTISAPVLRHSYNRWGATAAEVTSAMPGDDLVPRPKITSTRAITIGAPPAEVWSWVVQIGQGRGGFYSFDALENMYPLRCDIHSADRILPQLQGLHAGDLILLAPAEAPCFRVATVEPPWVLVLAGADLVSRAVLPTRLVQTSWPTPGSGCFARRRAAVAPGWWSGSATATRADRRPCGTLSRRSASSWSTGCCTGSMPAPKAAAQPCSRPDLPAGGSVAWTVKAAGTAHLGMAVVPYAGTFVPVVPVTAG